MEQVTNGAVIEITDEQFLELLSIKGKLEGVTFDPNKKAVTIMASGDKKYFPPLQNQNGIIAAEMCTAKYIKQVKPDRGMSLESPTGKIFKHVGGEIND